MRRTMTLEDATRVKHSLDTVISAANGWIGQAKWSKRGGVGEVETKTALADSQSTTQLTLKSDWHSMD
jgi:hypothetical protein